jgi:phosphate transport system permease protein
MTDVTAPKPTDWTTPAMQARIKKRYQSERRFRALGLGALMLASAFLVFLLGDILIKGASGFLHAQVRVPITFDPASLGVTAEQAATADGKLMLEQADFTSLIRDSLSRKFTNVEGRSDRKELGAMVSIGADVELRNMLLADPSLIGKTVNVWLTAGDDLELVKKGMVDVTAAEENRIISDKKLGWIQQLDRQGDIKLAFNTGFFTGGDSREPELAGIWGAMVGSFLTLIVTLSLCFPVGVASAIYLEEFAPKNLITDFIEVNINNLAAVPSIVFGLLGLAVFLGTFDMPRSAPLVGGLTLALMTLPTIVIASRVSIKAVPPSIRDAARGIGASPLQVVFHHVLPSAMPGILTGTIIGMSRALGETAPLIMIGMVAFIVDVPASITEAATVLPVQIFIWADSPERLFVEKTSAAIIVLLAFLISMNGLAIYLRNKFEKRW